MPLMTGWLDDPVWAVRETSVDALKRLIRQFGTVLANSLIVPAFFSLSKHRNYLRRITFLYALSATCSVVSVDTLRSQYLPILNSLAADPIANVRLNVAKTLQTMVPVLLTSELKDSLAQVIIPILQGLQRDADVDVHDFATRALNMVPAF